MSKRFAYCIGGCRTVPPFLDALTTDRADCYPVFFKEPGPPGSIFLPNSTTNTGRNEAFRRATEGDPDYIVLMDDDVKFAGMSHADGFRKFEALLDELNPAIAVPKYSWHLKGQNKESAFDPWARVQGLGAADAIVNAFHRDVWRLFLPYWTGGDADSWWNAQQIVHRLAHVIQPGMFVQFNDLEAVNLVSGPYPRAGQCVAADAYLREFTRPEYHAQLGLYRDRESFHAYKPYLASDYRFSREHLAERFDLTHDYFRDRL